MLTAPRRSQKFAGGGLLVLGIAAAAVCLQGGLAIVDDGFARPARAGQGGNDFAKIGDAATARAVGVFASSANGGVANGDVTIGVEQGTFLLKNSAGVDAIGNPQLNRYCYIVDDNTVAKTSASGTRPVAGIVREVTVEGVWVEISAAAAAAAPQSVFLPFAINQVDLLAGTAAELVSPVAGAIARLTTIVQTAVTTGGPITAAIGVTAIAGLSCVIADAAVKGSVVTDTPTAGDATTVVAPGSRIQIIPDAAFATAGAVSGVLEIAL